MEIIAPAKRCWLRRLLPEGPWPVDSRHLVVEVVALHRVLGDQFPARASDVGDQATDQRPGLQSFADGATTGTKRRSEGTAHTLKDVRDHRIRFAQIALT